MSVLRIKQSGILDREGSHSGSNEEDRNALYDTIFKTASRARREALLRGKSNNEARDAFFDAYRRAAEELNPRERMRAILEMYQIEEEAFEEF